MTTRAQCVQKFQLNAFLSFNLTSCETTPTQNNNATWAVVHD